MATGSMLFVESGLADLDKILQSLEIENKQQQNEILKEQQLAAAFEAAVIEKEKNTKTLQADTSRLDEETKAAHQQFCCNKETYERVKSHYLALVQNQETAHKELLELQDTWQPQQAEHERALQHYESIWDQYKAKYEERELAVELRQWQQQAAQTQERLEDSQHKADGLKATIQEKQDKKQNSLKPFKSLNDWIIQIAEVWAKTRDLGQQKDETRSSIGDAERKIKDKTDRQLQQQKELEEQERKRKLKEAEEKKCQEETERQYQQQLYQQQQLKAEQQQLRQQQQLLRQQQFRLTAPPQQIPQSPLLQQPASTAAVQSHYFQSPLVGHAAARSTAAAASPQQMRYPPYLQMPIMASPRQAVGSGAGSGLEKGFTPQQFTLKMPGDGPHKNQQKQPQSAGQQSTDVNPSRHEAQALTSISAHDRAESSREQTNQGAIPRQQDGPIRESRGAAVVQPGVGGRAEEGGEDESKETLGAAADTSEAQQTPAQQDISLQDPGTPGSVLSLPPQSPFDLEAHMQSLNEMAKSPGFAYPCRSMFAEKEINVHDEVPGHPQSDAPPTSSSDNLESLFFQPFFSGMGGVIQPSSQTPAQMFGSSNQKAPSHSTGTSIFGRPNSPMDIGQSRTQEGLGVLSLFGGGGRNKTSETRDDEDGSAAGAFSFNFTGGSGSPNVNSSGEGKFSLF